MPTAISEATQSHTGVVRITAAPRNATTGTTSDCPISAATSDTADRTNIQNKCVTRQSVHLCLALEGEVRGVVSSDTYHTGTTIGTADGTRVKRTA